MNIPSKTTAQGLHQWALSAGFCDTIPVIPAGATLHPESRVDPRHCGKVPGLYYEGGWHASAGWPEYQMDNALADRWDRLGANVGLKMGTTYCALDVDILDDVTAQAVRTLLAQMRVTAPVRVGKAPKFLMLFKVQGDAVMRRQYPLKNGDVEAMVEVMGQSRKNRPTQAVILGTHPEGHTYTWESPISDATLPTLTQVQMDNLVEAVLQVCVERGWERGRPSAGGSNGDGRTSDLGNPMDDTLVADVLRYVPNDNRSWDDWIRIGLCLRTVLGFDDGWPFFWEWSSRSSKFDPAFTEQKWANFEPDGSLSFGTLVHEAREAGLPEEISRRVTTDSDFRKAAAAGMPIEAPALPILPSDTTPAAPRVQPPPLAFEDGTFTYRGDGTLHPNTNNVFLYLKNQEPWNNVFAFDAFRGEAVVKIPYPGEVQTLPHPRPLEDADYRSIHAMMQQTGLWPATISKLTVMDAVDRLCDANSEEPVQNYLNNLPSFMPMGLLDNWLFLYLGVERTGDALTDEYIRQVGRCWMVGAVARAFEPGCQMDNALILEGPQGVGKSSALRTLLPDPEWFGDALPDFHSKDSSEYMNGLWIIEMSELTNVIKSEVEDMRKFMTRRVEKYRPSYGRKDIRRPRRAVLAGSTNRDDYLKDVDGERRFWPVVVGQIDLEGLKANRDPLWKETYDAYQRGERWHMDPIVAGYAKMLQQERVEDDPWEPKIVPIVRDLNEVSPQFIADQMGIPLENWNQSTSRRITRILKRLGFERAGRFKTAAQRDVSRYVRK
ncbi:VapE domain-containing protein [Shimia sagamensis]|uniref:Primase C terminal 2 (PriCT-2) n=1 Tax=Shimia sagamensis TaxID=1566352 RepID=A0ABY1PIT8_9RHOB|nr:VapE domain-containing protein [Shimia sagamensis]SMP35309.1 Primase C terminal 2 (PriCT-2) [Shimia sagamensis]